jgi:hypothetical protein
VIGLTIMPLSDRFTRSTSDACSPPTGSCG